MKLLRQVRIIDPWRKIDRLADVSIANGKIKAIAERIDDYSPDSVIEGEGLVLGTGLTDLYSHSGEPGNEARETLLSLVRAAMAGGFTRVGILPDTVPRIDNAETLAAMIHKSNCLKELDRSMCLPQLHFWGAGCNDSGKMNELEEFQAEVLGFVTQHRLSNLNVLKQILEYVQPWQKPLSLALDRNELSGEGVVREGKNSIRYGMLGNPGFSEAAIIAAVLEIVAQIPTPIHIMRVSTSRGVELIAEAKSRNLPVTASTTWMHLLHSSDAVSSYNPNLRLEPPLGNNDDRESLIDGVEQGIIDAIAIDHQAYTYEEKTVAFALAPSGVVGLEIALPLLWQKFVASGRWSALTLWQALSSGPRQCMQLQPNAIAPGEVADLVLFDPRQTWIAEGHNLKSPAANTPWYGRQITGKAIEIWVNSVSEPKSSALTFNS
jgi:dihydroorotase